MAKKFNRDVRDAVKNREVLLFDYDGGRRRVEPHCHGRNKDTDNELLRAWQTNGDSGWKLFKVSEIKGISLPGRRFNFARKGYNPDDEAMDAEIYANL